MGEIPLRIKNYFIREVIDSGESASVHLAYNIITQEECCVKIIKNRKEKVV
jgi:hypothetical protein